MQKYILSCFLIPFLKILAFSTPDKASLAVTEGHPSSFIEGCVSAITGDLYFHHSEILVKGKEPVRFPLYYFSRKGTDHSGGWIGTQNHIASFFLNTYFYLSIPEVNGTEVFYYCPHETINAVKKTASFEFLVDPLFFDIAITNAKNGEMSGRYNYKNNKAQLDQTFNHLTVYAANGSQRHYIYFKSPKADMGIKQYLLQWERLPNGNRIYYRYDSNYNLIEVCTTNPQNTKTYASLKISYVLDKKQKLKRIDFKASDNQRYSYFFRRHDKKNYLYQYETTTTSNQHIQYLEKNNQGLLIERILFPKGRLFEIDYYAKENNIVDNQTIPLSNLFDPRFKRVKMLLASVGNDSTLYPTHQILYPKCKHGQPGRTDVKDIEGNHTIYRYGEDLRLTSIEYYQKHFDREILSHKELFCWEKAKHQTFLFKAKTILDHQKKPLRSKKYHYDQAGNVIQETIYGNISGSSKAPLLLDTDMLPIDNGTDSYSKYKTYSTDGRNLLLSESEDNGRSVQYRYLPNTDLIVSKWIYDHNHIKKRYFYEYNEENVLVKEITDNGSSEDPNDHSVTFRIIKEITPRSHYPFINFPEIIEEKYYDPESKKEVPLKSIHYTYSEKGKLIRKDISNGKGEYCYSLNYTYDPWGRLSSETNPLGYKRIFQYDENDNKILEKDFNGKVTAFIYDLSNRLIQTTEMDDQRNEKITKYDYDKKNRLIAKTDEYGNTTYFKYDAFDHLIQIIYPPCLTNQDASITPITKTHYDALGNPIAFIDANGHQIKKTFNIFGNPTSIMYSDGTQESFCYHLDGTMHKHIDGENTVTTYTYDIEGNMTSKTIHSPSGDIKESWEYDGFHLLKHLDPDGVLTTYTYDGAGRKIEEKTAKETIRYAYDALGYLSSITNGLQITTFKVDFTGKILEEIIQDETGKPFSKKRFEYDSIENLKKITTSIMEHSSSEIYTYDKFGRLIKSIDPEGQITEIHYTPYENSLNQTVLQKITCKPNGDQIIETFDAFGKLSTCEKKSPEKIPLSFEEYYYDPTSNLLSKCTTTYLDGSPTSVTQTQFKYDAQNRLIAHIDATDTDTSKTTHYTYTTSGKIHQIIKPDGVILEHSYNALGHLISLLSSDSKIHYTFTYNNKGNLLSSRDHILNQTTYRTLDPKGRILSETLANGLTIQNTYDDFGRKITSILPDFSTIHYTYEAYHLTSVLRNGHTYAPNAYDSQADFQATSPTQADKTFFYDPLDRLTKIITPQDETTFTYDSLNRCIAKTYTTPETSTQTLYLYDDQNKIGSFDANHILQKLYILNPIPAEVYPAFKKPGGIVAK